MPNRSTLPPTDGNMGPFLASMKDDLKEIKDDTRHTREDVVALKTDLRGTKGRVKKLEEKTDKLGPHVDPKNCPNTEAVVTLREGQETLQLKVNTAEVNIADQSGNLDKIEKKDSKRIFWLLGMVAVVIGSVFGWYESRATMRANISALTANQNKVIERVDNLVNASNNQTKEVKQAARDVRNAADEVSNGESKQVPVDVWWRTLDDAEKRLLIRRGIHVPLAGEAPH